MDYSPPSDSPRYSYTPDWVRQQRRENERKAQEEINRKRAYIALITNCLCNLPEDKLRNYLIDLINSNKDLYKRYAIAEAINEITADKDLYNKETQTQIIKQFKYDIFDPKSELYKALDIQRSLIFRFTLFGKMHWLSWSAESLQQAQSIIREQNTNTNTNSI